MTTILNYILEIFKIWLTYFHRPHPNIKVISYPDKDNRLYSSFILKNYGECVEIIEIRTKPENIIEGIPSNQPNIIWPNYQEITYTFDKEYLPLPEDFQVIFVVRDNNNYKYDVIMGYITPNSIDIKKITYHHCLF